MSERTEAEQEAAKQKLDIAIREYYGDAAYVEGWLVIAEKTELTGDGSSITYTDSPGLDWVKRMGMFSIAKLTSDQYVRDL